MLKILVGENCRGFLADWPGSRMKCVRRIPKITYPFVEKLFLPLKGLSRFVSVQSKVGTWIFLVIGTLP